MTHCFRCGKEIEGDRRLRRRVKTGDWVRRRYGAGPVLASSERHGMRVVCGKCAKELDYTSFRNLIMQHASVVIALIGLVLVLAAMRYLGQA